MRVRVVSECGSSELVIVVWSFPTVLHDLIQKYDIKGIGIIIGRAIDAYNHFQEIQSTVAWMLSFAIPISSDEPHSIARNSRKVTVSITSDDVEDGANVDAPKRDAVGDLVVQRSLANLTVVIAMATTHTVTHTIVQWTGTVAPIQQKRLKQWTTKSIVAIKKFFHNFVNYFIITSGGADWSIFAVKFDTDEQVLYHNKAVDCGQKYHTLRENRDPAPSQFPLATLFLQPGDPNEYDFTDPRMSSIGSIMGVSFSKDLRVFRVP
uniref:DOMON domain-containing protein n=1 Tax=Ascaris lumbricoides TaxID=6252 RepID=A0A0M3HF37_ASCLU